MLLRAHSSAGKGALLDTLYSGAAGTPEKTDALPVPEAFDLAAEAFLSRSRIEAVVNSPDFRPRDLISELKKEPALKLEYEKDAGVWEGYSLEEHTLMMMGQFERYFRDALPKNADRGLFRLMLALHDIGKPAAVAAGDIRRQHEFTRETMRRLLTGLNYQPSQVNLAVAIVDGDAIGHYLRADIRTSLDITIREIDAMARRSGLSPEDFFPLLQAFYMSDAGSYTEDAGGKASLDHLFVFDHDKRVAAFAPAVAEMMRPLQEHYRQTPTDRIYSEIQDFSRKLVQNLGNSPPAPDGQTGSVSSKILMRADVPDARALDFFDRYGIVNQYVTGTSNGMLSFKFRYLTEQALAGNYSPGLSLDVLPKYGYLNVIGRPSNLEEHRPYQYGKVVFELKDSARERATFHVGDSLFAKGPALPLDSLSNARTLGEQPSYYEAQVWGLLSLEDVESVLLDTQYDPLDQGILDALIRLADKYGFSIYEAKHAIAFNQSSGLNKSLLYEPAEPPQAGRIFRFMSPEEIFARLKTAGEFETALLLHQLRTVSGTAARDTLLGLRDSAHQSVRRAAAFNLADLGDAAARDIPGLDQNDDAAFIDEKLRLRRRTLFAKDFDPTRMSLHDLSDAVSEIDPLVASGSRMLLRLAKRHPAASLLRAALADALLDRGWSDGNRPLLWLLAKDKQDGYTTKRLAGLLPRFPAALQPRLAGLLAKADSDTQLALLKSLQSPSIAFDPAGVLRALSHSRCYPNIANRALASLVRRGGARPNARTIAGLLGRPQDVVAYTNGLTLLTLAGVDTRVLQLLRREEASPWWRRNAALQAARVGLEERSGHVLPELLDFIFAKDDNSFHTFEHVAQRAPRENAEWLETQLTRLGQTGITRPARYFNSIGRLVRHIAENWTSAARIPTLARLAFSDDALSRQVAVQSLGLIGTPQAERLLAELLSSDKADVRHGARTALDSLRPPRS